MSYIVPVHRPTSIRHAIKLNFINPTDDTLIVAKANRLEVYTHVPGEGLTLLHSRTVYGFITMLSGLRLASSPTDHLFVGTDRYQYFTCSWDVETRSIKTEQSYVDQADKAGRDSTQADRCHLDPTGRYMTLELYDGVISVVPVIQASNKRVKRESTTTSNADASVGKLGEPVQVRIEEMVIRDSAVLEVDAESKANPKLALLWEDNQSVPQLKIRELRYTAGSDQAHVDLDTVAELKAELDLGVSHLIPVSAPYGGFLVLGERSITYIDAALEEPISRDLEDNATIWTCWTKVDETRWLLADDYGRLFFLMIEVGDGKVYDWRLDALGEASRASCLVYLDEGLVFIGSHSGDSQVVRIVEGGVDVLQTISNIAPILDFAIMDLGRGNDSVQTSEFSSGQARIVAASGAWQDGSIRSVRSGVGLEEVGIIGEIPLINEMWALSSTGLGDSHDILLATFINETRIFRFDAEAIVEELAEFPGIATTEPTILAANLPDRKLIQVYDSGVNVTDLESGMSIFQWKPDDAGAKITSACTNGSHLIIVQGGQTVHAFQISGDNVSESSKKTFPSDSQLSSVTLPDTQSGICIASFWQTATVAVLDLNSLDAVHTQSLGEASAAVPRSVLVAQVLPDVDPTLFIAMADGVVLTYAFDTRKNRLHGMTRILLGTEPVTFKALPRTDDSGRKLTNVFASCEQPSLIYASEGRIIYSAVNTAKSARICSANFEAYPGAVALASPTELKLGIIGANRTTQLQALPVGETVRCIAYEPKAKLFGMGCIRRLMESGVEALLSSVKIASDIGFQELDSIELNDNELVECIVSLPPEEDEDDDSFSTLFVVGTSLLVDPDNSNPPAERGRIIVYRVDAKRQKLKIVTEARTKGACRSLAICEGKIVAGLVKVVALYQLIPSRDSNGRFSHELTRLSTYRTSTNPLSLSVQPSTASTPASIAVADLMKSLSVLHVVSPSESDTGNWQLQEVARHFATVWSSATAAVGENEWVLADMDGNLAMLRRNTEAVTYDEQRRLELTGEMRLGEVVNKIVPIFSPSAGQTAAKTPNKGKERSRTISSGGLATFTERNARSSRVGPLIQPQAFIATSEGAIYMLGAINAPYIDALIRLQNALASKVQAPGYMPWSRYRAWKTEVRESDEPFRFVDGEMLESGLLSMSSQDLEATMRENGLLDKTEDGGLELSLEEVRGWAEELRRLY